MSVHSKARELVGAQGGTASVTGATHSTPYAPGLPIIWQVPVDGPPGIIYMDGNGNIISAEQVQQMILTGAARVRHGTPPNINLPGGTYPSAAIPPEAHKWAAVPSPAGPPGPGDGALPPGDGGAGAGVSQSQQTTYQPIAPPVFDVLGELRGRRQTVRDAALANFEAILGAAPLMAGGLEYFPGLEPGGRADILMGILSGKGTAGAASLISPEMRQPERVPLPGLASPLEPTLGSEWAGALGLAKQILDSIRLFTTGQASATGGTSGGTSQQISDAAALAYVQSIMSGEGAY